MAPPLVPARWRRFAGTVAAGAVLLLAACSGTNDAATAATPTAAPAITSPAELEVPRGGTACFIRQQPAVNLPAVKSYRLAEARPLPVGVNSTIKSVRFLSGGANKVLEAEVCFTADGDAPAGRHEAHLELRLYSVDSEKLVVADRISPVRVLPFTQVLQVR